VKYEEVLTREFLEEEYVRLGKGLQVIAKEQSIKSHTSVLRALIKHNIPRRQRKKLQDLTGQQFGDLQVIRRTQDKNAKSTYWECKCICGKTLNVVAYTLKDGGSKTCGCGKKRTGSNNRKWKGYGEISGNYWRQIRSGAIKRLLLFEITLEYAWDLFLKQNRKCALSGVILVFAETKRSEATASLDRKDSSKGYVEGNVQWVHKDVNYMKQDLDESYFIEMCRKISNLAKRKRKD
jgi:hypothetical protein